MNIQELNVDYQIKTEELIKEAIFLKQYSKHNNYEKNDILEKEEEYVR